jgi:outer membrane lipopolysaccharide assembly protein LptE/RlpB
MMQTDVKSAHRSTAGSFYVGRTRLKAFIVTPAVTTACTFELRDGSATGPVLFTMDITSQTVANSFYIMVPGEGILAANGLNLTLTTGSLTGLTVFYG